MVVRFDGRSSVAQTHADPVGHIAMLSAMLLIGSVQCCTLLTLNAECLYYVQWLKTVASFLSSKPKYRLLTGMRIAQLVDEVSINKACFNHQHIS